MRGAVPVCPQPAVPGRPLQSPASPAPPVPCLARHKFQFPLTAPPSLASTPARPRDRFAERPQRVRPRGACGSPRSAGRGVWPPGSGGTRCTFAFGCGERRR